MSSHSPPTLIFRGLQWCRRKQDDDDDSDGDGDGDGGADENPRAARRQPTAHRDVALGDQNRAQDAALLQPKLVFNAAG